MSPVVTGMESAKGHRAKAAGYSKGAAGAEAVGALSRILAEHAGLLKAVVAEYEQCGVALEAAYEELERRDAASRDAAAKLRRAAYALKTRRPHRQALALVNDALLSCGQP